MNQPSTQSIPAIARRVVAVAAICATLVGAVAIARPAGQGSVAHMTGARMIASGPSIGNTGGPGGI
jgi:hypothetical protein